MNNIIDPSVIIPLSHYNELKTLLIEESKNIWISTKLKLPDEREEVILVNEYHWSGGTSISYYVGHLVCLKNGKKYFSSRHKLQLDEVKYWMKIPKVPQECA